MYKEGELELLREALNSEIQFLKSVSFCVVNKAFIHLPPASDRISCITDQGRKIQLRCSTLLFVFRMSLWEEEVQNRFIFRVIL